jgi:hypothetical protein
MRDSQLTFVTTTSYGSWLPGDCRGYVERGEVLPASLKLERNMGLLLKRPAVRFSDLEQIELTDALLAACDEFGYRLFDLTVEIWHLHWTVRHPGCRVLDGRAMTRAVRGDAVPSKSNALQPPGGAGG